MPIEDDLKDAGKKAKEFGSKALDTVTEYGTKAYDKAKELGGKAYDSVKGVANDADKATGGFLSNNSWLLGGVVVGLLAMFNMEGGLMPMLLAVGAIIGGIFMDGKNGMFGDKDKPANSADGKEKEPKEKGLGKGKGTGEPELVNVPDKQKITLDNNGAKFLLESGSDKKKDPALYLEVDANGKIMASAQVKPNENGIIDPKNVVKVADKAKNISDLNINLPVETDEKGKYINMGDSRVINTIKSLSDLPVIVGSITPDKQDGLRAGLGEIKPIGPVASNAAGKATSQFLS